MSHAVLLSLQHSIVTCCVNSTLVFLSVLSLVHAHKLIVLFVCFMQLSLSNDENFCSLLHMLLLLLLQAQCVIHELMFAVFVIALSHGMYTAACCLI